MATGDTTPEGPEHPTRPDGGRHHEPDLRGMTRITLRPIASPMPLGFYTVAIASTIVDCLQLGLFEDGAEHAVALTILPAFFLQLLVGFHAFGARDVLAATLMACFSGMWLASSLVLATQPPGGARVLGVLNLCFALFALLMASVARPKRALWLVLCTAAAALAVRAGRITALGDDAEVMVGVPSSAMSCPSLARGQRLACRSHSPVEPLPRRGRPGPPTTARRPRRRSGRPVPLRHGASAEATRSPARPPGPSPCSRERCSRTRTMHSPRT